MRNNVKIAKELVKLAKSLVTASSFGGVNIYKVFAVADGVTLKLNNKKTARFIFSKNENGLIVMSCAKLVFDCTRRSEEECANYLAMNVNRVLGQLFGFEVDYMGRNMTFGSIGYGGGQAIVSDFNLEIHDVYKAWDVYDNLKLNNFKVDDSFAENP